MIGKNVQISDNLFIDICSYFFDDCAPRDLQADNIRKQLLNKLDKLITRELFTEYKRMPTGEERGDARRKYLERVGLSSNFISSKEIPFEKI